MEPCRNIQVVLETERLLLREWTPGDAQAYFEIYQDPEMFRWLGNGTGKPPKDVAQVRQRLERRVIEGTMPKLGLWATLDKSRGRIVGNCGLVQTPESGEIELVYHIARPDWGLGYATEAARACLEYGLKTLNLARVVGLVYPENRASARVLEKIGMRPEGECQAYGTTLKRYAAVSRPE